MNVHSASALELLLPAVRRRLRMQRASRALRTAAWILVAVAGVAILAHFFLVSLRPRWLIAAFAAIPVVALASSLVRRPSREACADWADRHLGGNSAFATYLEASAAGNAVDSAALAHLRAYVDERAAHAGSMLRLLAPERRFVRPLAAACVCVALAATLMQIPGQGSTAGENSLASAGPSELQDSADPAAADDSRDMAAAADQGQAGAESRDGSEPEPEASGAQLAPRLSKRNEDATTTADSQAAADAAELEGAAEAGISKEPGSGREAGSSRDSSDGMQSSAAWRGELVAKLRQLTSRSDASHPRADAEKAGEYSAAGTSTQETIIERSGVEPLAAAAPSASDAIPLDPATQAYVRRYFDSAGDAQ